MAFFQSVKNRFLAITTPASRKASVIVAGGGAVATTAIGVPNMVGAAPVTFGSATLPFNVPDMLTSAINFLTLYADWLLLALGVIFSPVLYGLAMKLVKAAKASFASK